MCFFFKQRTAYEFRLSLVGSEMCIGGSSGSIGDSNHRGRSPRMESPKVVPPKDRGPGQQTGKGSRGSEGLLTQDSHGLEVCRKFDSLSLIHS